jgi:long-chain acyl-CoA synthetase
VCSSDLGRIKDQFKTDKGKYISPAPIELILLAGEDIEQACVVGMGIPQPIVLINLSAVGQHKSKDELIKSLSDTLVKVNATLDNFEQVRKIVITREEWTVGNGMMTPTLKIRRNELETIHLRRYAEWFERIDTVIWED